MNTNEMQNDKVINELLQNKQYVEMAKVAIYLKGKYPALARDYIRNSEEPLYRKDDLLDVFEQLLLVDAQNDFDCYNCYLDFGAKPLRQFHLPRRKNMWSVIQGLQDLADGKIKVLRVRVPPRRGKSQYVNNFKHWELGRHPYGTILTGVGGGELADSIFAKSTSFITEFGKRHFEVFPKLEVKRINIKSHGLWYEDMEYASDKVVSITANFEGSTEAITGEVLDDCVDKEMAYSEERMRELYEENIQKFFLPRQIGGWLLLIGTPVAVEEPLKWLYKDKQAELGQDMCREIVIPMLNSDGKSNFEMERWNQTTKKYELVDTTEEWIMRKQIAEINPASKAVFYTRWLCEPMSAEGLLFPDLLRFDKLPDLPLKNQFVLCDTATKGSDSFVIVVANEYDKDEYIYVSDVFMDNSPPLGMSKKVYDWLVERDLHHITIESNGAGSVFSTNLQEYANENRYSLKIDEYAQLKNKAKRIFDQSPLICSKFKFKSEYTYGSMYYKFIDEVTRYPADGKVDHDDAADTLASVAERLFVGKKKNSIFISERIF